MPQGPKVREAIKAARTARQELDLGLTGPLPDILTVVEDWLVALVVLVLAWPEAREPYNGFGKRPVGAR